MEAATSAKITRTGARIGRGTKVHQANYVNGTFAHGTYCGARGTVVRPTDLPVNCERCLATLEAKTAAACPRCDDLPRTGRPCSACGRTL